MIYWVLILLIFIGLLIIIGIFRNRFLKEKKLKEIRASWGRPKNIYRSFKLINSYLSVFGIKNEASAADLDLDDVFCFIDRTNSKPGQQYLYKQLHSSDVSKDYFVTLEQRIDKFNENQNLREITELKLADLNNNDAYYLPELFSKTHNSIFGLFVSFYIKIGMPLLLAFVIAFIVVPNQLYFILLLFCLVANVVIHISNKTKI